MTTTVNPQILILGGGFAGPVLALALHSRGIESVVYDVRPEGYEQGGNVALAPNALRVLDAVGVYDDVRLGGYNYEELHLSNAKGHELGKFLNGSQQRYNYPAIRVHRRDVRNFLLRKMKAEGIPIYYNKKAHHLVSEAENQVTIGFEDGTEATGQFAVGCDGIHSKVRGFIYPDSEPIFQDAVGIMGTVYQYQLTDVLGPVGQQDSRRWPTALPRFTFGDNGMFGSVPANFNGTEFGFMSSQRTHARTREEWTALEKDKSQIKQIIESAFMEEHGGSHYPPEVRLLVERVKPETLSSWPFYIVPKTPKWYSEKGRIIWIGDAAHAIPPNGGQGSAMAFEDAATLALTLSRIIRPDPTPNVHTGAPVLGHLELLNRWHLHRSDRIKNVTDFTSRNGELMKSSPLYVQQAAKEWVMWAALKLEGPGAGAEWLYSYQCENVLAALAN